MRPTIIQCRPRGYEYTAIPLTGDNLAEVARRYVAVYLNRSGDALTVHTFGGVVTARPGMVLLEDPHGEYEVLTFEDYQDQYEEGLEVDAFVLRGDA